MTTFMSLGQVAAYAGISTRQVSRNVHAGEFRALKFGKRWMFLRSEIQEWKKRRKSK